MSCETMIRSTHALALLLLGACAGEQEEPTPSVEPRAPSFSNSLASSAASWRIEWQAVPETIAVNELFDVRARVLSHDGGAPPAELELVVDAAMPQHQHGMVRRVLMHREGELATDFRAEGLQFHMPGDWRLYFDVTHAGLTERAECVITLD